MQIISANDRLARRTGVKAVVVGPHGIGKTSLLWTLDPATTLFVNMEAGDLAIEGWSGDTIGDQNNPLRDYETLRNLACWIGGVNPSRRPDEPYSKAHFDFVCSQYGDPAQALAKYTTIFMDSIMEISRLCLHWCRGQPRAFSEKTGKLDSRGAYGLLGEEMIGLLRHVQHVKDKSIIFVGGLDKRKDDYGRSEWTMQLEGGKTQLELPGIVDQVISMVEIQPEGGEAYRAFVCHTLNPWKYPAKDRSGRLDMIEEPHLGKLIAKMTGGGRTTQLVHSMPTAGDASARAAAATPQPPRTGPIADDEVPF